MAGGVVVRKDVNRMTPSDLQALRNAYTKMMGFSGGDNRSWIYWAGYHGYPNWFCWHHSAVGQGNIQPYDLFLPWHRAYLLYWEHAARDQDSDMVLPWWDWTSDESHQNGLPKAFTDPKVGGVDNPLYAGSIPPVQGQPGRKSKRFPGDPQDLPTAAQVDDVVGLSSFVDFSSQLQDIHDDVHGWTGGGNPSPPPLQGDMAIVGLAAFDPIFWSHHCMIDRIWYLWQLKHGVSNIPEDYLTKPLQPFNLTVADVLDVRALGYDYAVSSIVV
jgi:tyrosinase